MPAFVVSAFVPVSLASQPGDDLGLLLPGGVTRKLARRLEDAKMRRVLAAVVEGTAEADAS